MGGSVLCLFLNLIRFQLDRVERVTTSQRWFAVVTGSVFFHWPIGRVVQRIRIAQLAVNRCFWC